MAIQARALLVREAVGVEPIPGSAGFAVGLGIVVDDDPAGGLAPILYRQLHLSCSSSLTAPASLAMHTAGCIKLFPVFASLPEPDHVGVSAS
jgi:hypothetical protein